MTGEKLYNLWLSFLPHHVSGNYAPFKGGASDFQEAWNQLADRITLPERVSQIEIGGKTIPIDPNISKIIIEYK